MALWEITVWDKKFNSVEKYKQKRTNKYHYFLANELKSLIRHDKKEVRLLTTNASRLYTTKELVGDKVSKGEIVAIPWGGNAIVQYYNGNFVTADNRIVTSQNTNLLNNKYLYYYLLNNIKILNSLYRGSGIKHPNMSKLLDLQIPIPSIKTQKRIVSILDKFEKLTSDLSSGLPAEIKARRQQYEYYRNKLLTFNCKVNET
jgi:type I restriction enzyme S subunit